MLLTLLTFYFNSIQVLLFIRNFFIGTVSLGCGLVTAKCASNPRGALFREKISLDNNAGHIIKYSLVKSIGIVL